MPFETDGTVSNAMLRLDANSKPHVLLSTMKHVYYATCDGDCSDPKAWTQNVILEPDGDQDVSGRAFGLSRASSSWGCSRTR